MKTSKSKEKKIHKGNQQNKTSSGKVTKNKFIPKFKKKDIVMEKKNNKVVHQYHKNLKKERHRMNMAMSKVEKIYKDAGDEIYRPKTKPKQNMKVSAFHKEEKKWKLKQAANEKSVELANVKKAALEKYHKEKEAKHKKLAKRNYKGQPNMASQMELLLEKIQGTSTS